MDQSAGQVGAQAAQLCSGETSCRTIEAVTDVTPELYSEKQAQDTGDPDGWPADVDHVRADRHRVGEASVEQTDLVTGLSSALRGLPIARTTAVQMVRLSHGLRDGTRAGMHASDALA